MPLLHVQCAASIPLETVIIAAAAGCGLALAAIVAVGLAGWWAMPKVRCFLADGEDE